jgi:hypothetical protein
VLAPLEEANCVFQSTHSRHECARWLSKAQTNLGMKSELDSLFRGLVLVRPPPADSHARNHMHVPIGTLHHSKGDYRTCATTSGSRLYCLGFHL